MLDISAHENDYQMYNEERQFEQYLDEFEQTLTKMVWEINGREYDVYQK